MKDRDPSKKQRTPHFQAYQGFAQLLLTSDEMRDYIKDKYKWSLEHGFANTKITQNASESDKRAYIEHKSVRLLGTFFTDSFDPNLLRSMIKQADKGTFDIKILMLDPYRDVAKKRGDALGLSPVEAVEDAVRIILKALKDIHGNIPSLNRKKHKNDKREHLYYLLKDLKKYGSKSNISVRFYHSLTDSPIYLISQFVIKGLILEGVTSDKKPWMVFVDSISQTDDIYDQYSNNFNLIFHNYRLDKDGNPLTGSDGRRLRDANHSREWPIGLDIMDSNKVSRDKANNPNNSVLKKKLYSKLEKDDLVMVAKKLVKYSEEIKRESLTGELFELLGRLNHNIKRSNRGIISNKEDILERNKIRSHLCQLIRQL